MERMSEHTGHICSYQLLITAACTNTGGKIKGSHSRAADWCPFVPRHSLTHWDRVTHICVSELTVIGSDNGLSPGRRQALIWTNTGILLIRTLGTDFSEILGDIHSFSFSKMHLKMSSAKWRLSGLGLNELSQVTSFMQLGMLWRRPLQTHQYVHANVA